MFKRQAANFSLFEAILFLSTNKLDEREQDFNWNFFDYHHIWQKNKLWKPVWSTTPGTILKIFLRP
jgi:hypothetical protein